MVLAGVVLAGVVETIATRTGAGGGTVADGVGAEAAEEEGEIEGRAAVGVLANTMMTIYGTLRPDRCSVKTI